METEDDPVRIMYRAQWCQITRLQVDEVTDKHVIINGQRFAREGDSVSFHDTWEEAHSELLEDAAQRVSRAEAQLTQARYHHDRIVGMTPSAATKAL